MPELIGSDTLSPIPHAHQPDILSLPEPDQPATSEAVRINCVPRWNQNGKRSNLLTISPTRFESMTDVEDPLVDRIEEDRAAILKRKKLPAETNLRRIWDTFRTLRWVNDSSIGVFVTSTRTVLRNKDDDEPEDLTISGVFTIHRP